MELKSEGHVDKIIVGKGNRLPKRPSVTKFSESGEPQQMLVRQRRKDDCVIACLAMFLGYSYENVWDKYPKGIPRTLKDYEKKIQRLGINPIVFTPWIEETLDVDALISLPSLNVIGSLHMLVYREGRVYDPNQGRKNKKYYYNMSDDKGKLGVELRYTGISCIADLNNPDSAKYIRTYLKGLQEQYKNRRK